MRRYDSLARLGYVETDGIDLGRVHVFPKLDGTNARISVDENGQIVTGSRNRVLTEDKDNAGFYVWCQERAEKLEALITELADISGVSPDQVTVYGEFLVPHTLKTYRDEAWRDFHVFDVYNGTRYEKYDDYFPLVKSAGISVIAPLCVIDTPTEEQLVKQMEINTYLIKDGMGAGEGIVVKNYDWSNVYGRQVWAKMVRTEFKEKNRELFGTAEIKGKETIERSIATASVTSALVEKERAKLVNAGIEERKRLIPALLESVYCCVIKEDLYDQLKKHKNATVDFRRLRQFVAALTKEYAQDLF